MAESAQIAVIMGSQSDWPVMQHTVALLNDLGISHHAQVVSAHRTPDLLFEFASGAREQDFKVIIAAAGGAAHLPGMVAAKTSLPVIGVPIKSSSLNGIDSLLSIVQMPAGIPVATVAIGEAGAKNAAILAASILSIHDSAVQSSLEQYRNQQTQAVMDNLELDGMP